MRKSKKRKLGKKVSEKLARYEKRTKGSTKSKEDFYDAYL